jgi:hypothetical protein
MKDEDNPYRSPASDADAPRDETLRRYGIVPKRKSSAPGRVRSSLTTGNVVGQWIAFVMLGIGPVALGVLLLLVVPLPSVKFGVGGFFCVLGLVLGILIAWDVNEWVEIDGNTFRWKHLFTRQVKQREVGDLEAVVTLTLAFRTVTVRAMEGMFGRIKGFEFRFRGMRHGVRVFRADPSMTNVRELIEEVVSAMYQFGEVVPEIVNFDGEPLIRRLTFRQIEPNK